MAKFRIFTGGLGHESLTFTEQRTSLLDIQTAEICPASPLVDEYLAQEDVDLISGFMASGIPGGIVLETSYQSLKNSLLSSLKASLPVDAVVLRLHGSMTVESDRGLFHGELDTIKAIREIVGNDVLIAARLDLHGNIPEELAANLNIISALRTAPHRDYAESLLRAFKQTVFALKNNLKPFTAYRSLPLLLPGESVVTDSEPAKSLYNQLEEIDNQEFVLCSSLMVGFAWADLPWTGSSILVSGHTDQSRVSAAADKLAEAVWSRRHEFKFDGASCSLDQLSAYLNANSGSRFFLSDSGDNITAGASGLSLQLFSELFKITGKRILYSQIVSKSIITESMNLEPGGQLDLKIEDSSNNLSFEFQSQLISKAQDSFGSYTLFRTGLLDLIITENRYPLVFPPHVESLGIKQTDYDICTFKLGYLMPELKDLVFANPDIKPIIVLTKGPTQLEVKELDYQRIKRPVFPLDNI